MHLKPPARWRRTFQYKLVLYYFGLTMTVLLVSHMVSQFVLLRKLQADARFRMQQTMAYLTETYFGSPSDHAPQIIPRDEWPEPIRDSLSATYPDIVVGLIEEEDQYDGSGYEVIGSTGNERVEILISAKGRMWVSHSESVEEVFQSLERSMVHPLGETAAAGAELLLLNAEGERLAGAIPSGFSAATLARAGRRLKPSDEIILPGLGQELLMIRRMYDGNVLCLLNDFGFGHAELSRWRLFFIRLVAVFIPSSILIGWFISWQAMAGVKRVTAAARAFEAGHMSRRAQRRREGAEIEELCDSFNSMADRIEALVQELRDVTANIAHDIRTPITRIRGLVETTQWTTASEEERMDVAGMVIEECDQLAPLINDILEVARADAGMLELHREPFDLHAEIRKAVDVFSVSAQEKNMEFLRECPAGPVPMLGDRGRIQRVIANLLDNAIKYTPDGGQVHIRLSVDGRQARFEVADTGPGIPPAEQVRVFERFYRGDVSRSIQGNGLGLSLVKAIVRAHGGRVHFEPSAHSGCIIAVHLPLGT